ncbi:tetratricopeptide repeat protein [Novilysobacter erysipheiresistens]|uniref:Tetratricopeptide repeat protein n=1 Tax=Novilysobacter erysipheiresistens TaxID=1749332 RepID=A0ABU7YWV1_9GAMM
MPWLDSGRSLAVRTAMLAGFGLVAGLSTVPVRAEIVPMTPPVVLAPVPVPAPDGGTPADSVSEVVPAGGEAAEIVPAKPSSPVPPESTPTGLPESAPGSAAPEPPTGNIRWPSVPATTPAATGQVPASDPAQGQLLPDAEADANTGEVAPDPLQRGLEAYRGDGDPRSYAEAARWFRTAAEAGDRRAAMAYAYLQGLGLGIARDPVAARRLLQQLSEAGFARADYLAALLLAADPRPGASRREGEFRERAARGGDAVAQNAMGVHYQLQGDRTTAQMWYRRAADSGSAAAKGNLASLVRSEQAREQEATPAIAADDADALFEQARRHHRGDGVAVDYGKALQLYRRAAANGSKPAQQMLGLIQSRSLPGGGFDPGWMRQLAFAAVGDSGTSPVSSVAAAAQPQLDDPLSGLSALEP